MNDDVTEYMLFLYIHAHIMLEGCCFMRKKWSGILDYNSCIYYTHRFCLSIVTVLCSYIIAFFDRAHMHGLNEAVATLYVHYIN